MGFYLDPDKASTTYAAVADISQQPRGLELLVYGDFNANLLASEGNAKDEDITAALDIEGVEDMSDNFLSRLKPWLRYILMRSILYGVQEVLSWTDFILGKYRRLLHNVSVQDAQQNIDNYLVMDCLRGAAPDKNSCYLGKRKHFPLKPPMNPIGVDRLFVGFRGGITKTPWRKRPLQAWISPEIW